MTKEETIAKAIAAIKGDSSNEIANAIAEWVGSSFQYEPEEHVTPAAIVRHLEMTDCSACHAPAGLIYNHDIAARAAAWWDDIDCAVDAYWQETGQQPAPQHGALTIGFLVWFAVEWMAQEAAGAVRHAFGVEG